MFNARIKNELLSFDTPYNEARYRQWLQINEGKRVKIALDDQLSDEQRGYFEGAVVPAYASYHGMTVEQSREDLKREFNPMFIKRRDGSVAKIGTSTARLNKQKFADFLTRIIVWMDENGIPVPDPESYKQWRDSAPAVGEVYKHK